MEPDGSTVNRRAILALGSRCLIAGTAAVTVVAPQRAAAAKAKKADFFYQDRPKEGKSCATCRLFALAESGKGACAIVEGEVSPDGWCIAYSPRA
jgi:hypothetical protein